MPERSGGGHGRSGRVPAIFQGGQLAAVLLLGGALFTLARTGLDLLREPPQGTMLMQLSEHLAGGGLFCASIGLVIGTLFAAVPPLAVTRDGRIGNGALFGGLTGGVELAAHAWVWVHLHPDTIPKLGREGEVFVVGGAGVLAGAVLGAIAGSAFGVLRQSFRKALAWVLLWMLLLAVLTGVV
jgi:hypothetical protein